MKRRIVAVTALALAGLAVLAGLFVWRPWERAAPAGRPESQVDGAAARAVVIDQSGNLLVVAGDAQADSAAPVTRLTEDAGSLVAYLQPTAAPDGRQIAYVAVTAAGARLVVQGLDGSPPRTVFEKAEQRPFYLCWSPDSRSVAFLASDSAMHLYVVAADGSAAASEVREGQPSYFAWTADSARLLLHTNGGAPRGSIAQHTLGGAVEEFAEEPGDFQAPAWSADGTTRYVVVNDGARNRLVALTGEASRDLSPLTADSILFSLSPDRTRIAYQTLGAASRSPIHVIAVGGGAPQDLQPLAPLAFFWSPDGTRIAALIIEPRGIGPSGDPGVVLVAQAPDDPPALRLHWEVARLDDGTTERFAPFTPSVEFLTLVPYFDQYAASLALWSPDSTRLIYGTTSGVETLRIADGTITSVSDGAQGFWINDQ